MFCEAVVLKFVPVRVTGVPGKPDEGLKEVMVGGEGGDKVFITTLSILPVVIAAPYLPLIWNEVRFRSTVLIWFLVAAAPVELLLVFQFPESSFTVTLKEAHPGEVAG